MATGVLELQEIALYQILKVRLDFFWQLISVGLDMPE